MMRLLLDECVPPQLNREITGHEVRTVAEMGWRGKKNGDLLRTLVADGFQVLTTVDRNFRHQQNLESHSLGVIVLITRQNKLANLIPLMPSWHAALDSIRAGDVVEIRS